MEWTEKDVLQALPKIRALKGVRSAEYRNTGLAIVTKNLRHPLSWLPLPAIRMWIPSREYHVRGYSGGVSYSYRRKLSAWHKHPTLRIKDARNDTCTGENRSDYLHSRKQGPYMTAIQQLAMLQTIKSRNDERLHANKVIRLAWFGVMAIIITIWIVEIIHFTY